MLPCSDGTDRTFNANDLIAMAYLYWSIFNIVLTKGRTVSTAFLLRK
jgi:hypothetical protein